MEPGMSCFNNFDPTLWQQGRVGEFEPIPRARPAPWKCWPISIVEPLSYLVIKKEQHIIGVTYFIVAKASEKATSWFRFNSPLGNRPSLSFVGPFFTLPHFFSALVMLSTANLACSLASELTASSFSAANCSCSARSKVSTAADVKT